MQFEIKLQETKLKLQEEHDLKCQHKSTPSEQLVSQAKLPKLVITKFNGSFTDWPRFWGQFSEAVDKSSVPPVTKFTYLRELLDDRVRKTIEALPHSPEGYNRAKAILEERFGKESEIVKAYLKEIIDLPHTPTANPKKILEFFEKLSYNVQALESLNQLNHVNGMVSLTLEKLRTIRGDLVRNDPEWEQWDFIKLTNHLRLWTRRNPVDDFKPEPETFKKREKPHRTSQTQQRKSTIYNTIY